MRSTVFSASQVPRTAVVELSSPSPFPGGSSSCAVTFVSAVSARASRDARAGVDEVAANSSTGRRLSRDSAAGALTTTVLPPPASVTTWVTGSAPACSTSSVYEPGARLAIAWVAAASDALRAGPSSTMLTTVPVLSSTPTSTPGRTVDPTAGERVSVRVEPVDARLALPSAVPPAAITTPLSTVGTCSSSLMDRL